MRGAETLGKCFASPAASGTLHAADRLPSRTDQDGECGASSGQAIGDNGHADAVSCRGRR